MKTTFSKGAVALLAGLAVMGFNARAGDQPAGVNTYAWQFTSQTTTVTSDAGSASGPQVVVAPGEFASGWISQNAFFGTAAGIWDLGRQGTIRLNNLGPALGDSSQIRTFTVRVVQFMDGAFYTVPVTVAVPGATLVSSSRTQVAAASDGAVGKTVWMAFDTEWRLPAGTAAPAVTVTSAYDGSVVDSVSLITTPTVAADLVLSIQPVIGSEGVFELSWPAGAGAAAIESTSSLGESATWSALAATPQLSNGRYSVTTTVSAGAHFFRLKR